MTRQDRKTAKFPDLLKRDFTAPAPNRKWCGDMTEIPTEEGKLYLATVIDLYSRRLLACPTGEHPNAELAGDAIKIAAATRGGPAAVEGVIFHTDRGSTYTASSLPYSARTNSVSASRWAGSVRASTTPPRRHSSPPWNTRFCPATSFTTKTEARAVVLDWCHEFYNTRRRPSSTALLPPAASEKITADQPAAA